MAREEDNRHYDSLSGVEDFFVTFRILSPFHGSHATGNEDRKHE